MLFTTLSAVSCERLIDLKYHLRYSAIVRPRRVLKTAFFIWLINILFTFLQWAQNDVFRGIHLVMWSFFLLTTVIIQITILKTVIRHQRQIKKHHPTSTSAMRQMQIKLAINVASIVAVYVLFNLPVLVVTLSHQFLFGNIDSYNFYSWSETEAFFNSSLNPLVCVWRVKAIRKVIAEVFSKKSQRKDAFLVKFRKITPSSKNGEENELSIMIEP